MPALLFALNTYGFADGASGHSIDLGSAPVAGQWDELCVVSDITVSTPSGFTAGPTNVGGAGGYMFRRLAAGGEGSTVTVTTGGNNNTGVIFTRWGNINAIDDAAKTVVDGSAGTSTPAHTTGTLSESGELVLAFGALHNFGGANPTSPVWSAGYSALATVSQGSGSSGVVGFLGYRLDGAPPTESPQVSWTNSAGDRYMLTFTWTTLALPAVPLSRGRVRPDRDVLQLAAGW